MANIIFACRGYWAMSLLLLLAPGFSLSGCAMVNVGSVSAGEYIAMKRGDILTTGELSAATRDTLGVVGLDEHDCEKQARNCTGTLAASDGLTEERRLATLAEIWLQAAIGLTPKNQAPESDAALDAYLEVVRHAYAYLFFTARKPGARAFEDRQTQVRDYYNHAVQQAVTGLFQRRRRDEPGEAEPSDAPLHAGGWTISSDLLRAHLPEWRQFPEELIPASSLSFDGLRSIYRRDGFGAELVAVTPAAAAAEAVYSEMPAPAVTVLFRFDAESLEELLATRHLQIDGYDPYLQTTVELHGQQVPLAANFTAGYGLWLARSGFAAQSLRTLLGRNRGISKPQVYLMQTYDPQRRIVLMLHGLASSPEAWVNLANEVLGDETLRQHYQVWQVYYPTNMPIAVNHAAIRDAVAQTLRHFDPEGTAAASQNMVLIGHSMGGVLARLMVSSSQDQLWTSLGRGRRLEGARLQHVRSRLNPFLSFEPMPAVGQAIFIAAPHRGTPYAGRRIGRWIGNLVKLPATLLKGFEDVLRELTDEGAVPRSGNARLIPNSIDNLKDTDPFIRAAAVLAISPQVRYHSIIARREPQVPLEQSDDGVVPYSSAHLEGAESEMIITSGHSVQETVQAILEIRRILRDGLSDAE